MSGSWNRFMRYYTAPLLIASRNEAVRYFARRDLLGDASGDERALWELPATRKLLAKQSEDGSWRYPSHKSLQRAYDTYQTYLTLGDLVEKYALDRRNPSVGCAVDFIFSSQTEEGDIRGIYGPHFSPNYTAAMTEIAIKAGYAKDPRIARALEWLMRMRQEDGGWAVPTRTVGISFYDSLNRPGPVHPDRSKPFSHLITGIVLRAFAAHPIWCGDSDVHKAGHLLVSRFFKPDKDPDRRAASFWETASFPFHWTDIVSSLDTVSRLGMKRSESNVANALDWLASRQKPSGHFNLRLLAHAREPDIDDWIELAVSRVFKAFA